MPIDYVPQDQFIADSVAALIEEGTRDPRAQETYSSAVGSGVDEIMRYNLRQLSQEGSRFGRWEELLRHASERSEDQLNRALQARGITFDLSPYLSHASKSLAPAARELFILNRKLSESKLKMRIPDKVPVAAPHTRLLFTVTPLGLLGSVEGLLASPSPEVKSLQIERLRDEYSTSGEWFPFEVSVENLLFVIDDDGSIFVSTENYPPEMLDRAKTILHELARFLYQ
jgi:hypothetical protein